MCKVKMLWLSVFTFYFVVNGCLAISNTNFNAYIRDFSTDDVSNATEVKTLQKVESKNFIPIVKPNQIKFKEIPDSALSSSNNNRGYHEHPGYHFNDYEESPHFAYGNVFHTHDPHGDDVHGPHSYEHGYHEYDHHGPHHVGHHSFDHGHYKYHKHELISKAVLLPIAGIALLGAAAALVNNPILLQLGVISGKRRRRDTEEVTGPDFTPDSFKKYKETLTKEVVNENLKFKKANVNKAENNLGRIKYSNLKRRTLKTKNYRNGKYRSQITGSLDKTNDDPVTSPSTLQPNDGDLFIPIPLTLKP